MDAGKQISKNASKARVHSLLHRKGGGGGESGGEDEDEGRAEVVLFLPSYLYLQQNQIYGKVHLPVLQHCYVKYLRKLHVIHVIKV